MTTKHVLAIFHAGREGRDLRAAVAEVPANLPLFDLWDWLSYRAAIEDRVAGVVTAIIWLSEEDARKAAIDLRTANVSTDRFEMAKVEWWGRLKPPPVEDERI